jgi:hypothetical protein
MNKNFVERADIENYFAKRIAYSPHTRKNVNSKNFLKKSVRVTPFNKKRI